MRSHLLSLYVYGGEEGYLVSMGLGGLFSSPPIIFSTDLFIA